MYTGFFIVRNKEMIEDWESSITLILIMAFCIIYFYQKDNQLKSNLN